MIKFFAKRMFQYFYRIYDRHDVPITALVVFTGNSALNKLQYFNRSFSGTRLTYEYIRTIYFPILRNSYRL